MNWLPSGSNTGTGNPTSQAFTRLHPGVQRWLWEQGWTALHPVQEDAIPAILPGQCDVLIASPTASGKTEAAFLPICSQLAATPGPGVRALYVGPLKALINDQHERLEALCTRLDIPVTRWHGDASQAQKQRLLRQPAGIVLITPESLEAIFVNHGSRVTTLFGHLAYIVIDELHAFIGSERGRQVQSLLHRLEQAARRQIPRIGLSATLGDLSLAMVFLRPGQVYPCQSIVAEGGGQELRVQVRGYQSTQVEPDSAIMDDLFRVLRGCSNLVFANRRQTVEIVADRLRRRSEQQHLPNEFFPHHGSLAKTLRETLEARLKDRSLPTTAVCTNTLELGIDIGNVTSVAQIGAPPSVAALRQRLGRSGRRGEPAILRLYIQEDELRTDAPLSDLLRTELVQAVAIIQLLARRWYEPPDGSQLHLSTLIHQVLSLIAQWGGVSASLAWQTLCQSGPFQGLSPPQFAALLRSLGQQDLLQQTAAGTLVLGERGERLVNDWRFYAVFDTPEEYRLVCGQRELGSLPVSFPLLPATFLIFAGCRWEILAVHEQERLVELKPAPGGNAPPFGRTGGALIHDEVRQEMFRVYQETVLPSFLDRTAATLLQEARANFARLGLAGRHWLPHGRDCYLLPWRGDKVLNTLLVQLQARKLAITKEGPCLRVGVDAETLRHHLNELAVAGPGDPLVIAASVPNKQTAKYDRYLPETLLCHDYATRSLDVEGAYQVLLQMAGTGDAAEANDS